MIKLLILGLMFLLTAATYKDYYLDDQKIYFEQDKEKFTYAQYIMCNEMNLPQTFSSFLLSDQNFMDAFNSWKTCTSVQVKTPNLTQECEVFRANFSCDYLNDKVPTDSELEESIYAEFNSEAAISCFRSCQSTVANTKSEFFRAFINETQFSCASQGVPPEQQFLVQINTKKNSSNNYTIASKKQLESCQISQKCSCESTYSGDQLIINACKQQEAEYMQQIQNQTSYLCNMTNQMGEQFFDSQPITFSYLSCLESYQPSPGYVYRKVWTCKYQECSLFEYFPFGPIHPDNPTASGLLYVNVFILISALILSLI